MNADLHDMMRRHPRVSVVAPHEDLLHVLAISLINEHCTRLPDLSAITILLSNSDAAQLLRQHLLTAALNLGQQALLGPHIQSLRSWVDSKAPSQVKTVTDYARQLMLIEALSEHPQLYGKGSPWALSDSLLELFDELTLWNVSLPHSLDDFHRQLKHAYNIKEQELSALGYEANLVHSLWHALHEQLLSQALIDRNSRYLLGLSQALNHMSSQEILYFAGSLPQLPAEQRLFHTLLENRQLQIFTYPCSAQTPANQSSQRVSAGNKPDDEPYWAFLQASYDYTSEALLPRARRFATRYPRSPIEHSVSIYHAPNSEDEVSAIDIQVRRWLIQSKQIIGIVSENRKLARRLRAILERAGIELNDQSGWALSTTSAATLLERWLQTVEENFHYLALLDVLKSPFFFSDKDHDTHLNTVYRFEQSIVLQENISHGIERYLSHIEYRKKRLTQDLQPYYDGIVELLNLLAQAAKPLQNCLNAGEVEPGVFIDALLESLRRLPLFDTLQNDAAGIRVLEEINAMRTALAFCSIKMDWLAFRTWLGSSLEKFNFKLPARSQRVQLVTLNQSELQPFDALIFASAEQRYLPHTPRRSPFFNDTVRAELGLPTLAQNRAEQFSHFFRLLQSTHCPATSSPAVLFTLRRMEGDEEIIPSPWVQALQAFHQLAYTSGLNDAELSSLVKLHAGQIEVDAFPLPSPMTEISRAVTPQALLPKAFSASAYQQLMDCPYQYFAARCMQLAPADAIRSMLAKSDYGERVHLCLQAFHSKVANLPGPFSERLTQTVRQDAINLLEQISHVVFAKDIEINLLHRGWLTRWQQQIPHYIDWQIQQAEDWTTLYVEMSPQDAELKTPDGLIPLSGRIDRIDQDKEGYYIIDYKTGQTADLPDIQSGEAVQLPFYAMLAAHSSALQQQLISKCFKRVAYVKVNDGKINDRVCLDTNDIKRLSEQIEIRLAQSHAMMRQGQSLPAWGDNEVCSHCSMEGLCRRELVAVLSEK